MDRFLSLFFTFVVLVTATTALAVDPVYPPQIKDLVARAKQIASDRHHRDLLPEHLLLALARSGDSDFLNVLQSGGMTPEAFVRTIEVSLNVRAVGAISGPGSSSYPEPVVGPIFTNYMAEASKTSTLLQSNKLSPHDLLISPLMAEGDPLGSVLRSGGLVAQRAIQASQRIAVQEKSAAQVTRSEILQTLTTDLAEKAKQGKLDPVIGRDAQIDHVIQTLMRRRKNAALLRGEAGVGKTAIVEGLQLRIQSGDVPDELLGKRIVSLDLSALVGNTKYRGEFEQKVRELLKELLADRNVILFIDEVHTIMGAGGNAAEGGGQSLADILKPIMSREDFPVIGATTTDEYKKTIEKDPAAERRWQPEKVEPPDVDGTITILRGLKQRYEDAHKVKISNTALIKAARLSDRFIPERNLPDKAIDLIDSAAVFTKLEMTGEPNAVKELKYEIQRLQHQLLNMQDDKAAQSSQEKLSLRIEKSQKDLKELMFNWRLGQTLIASLASDPKGPDAENNRGILESIRMKYGILPAEVGPEQIGLIVARQTGIPIGVLTGDADARALEIEKRLGEHVVAQDVAKSALGRAMRRWKSGVAEPDKPIGVFHFTGPKGTGKNTLPKALAIQEFGSEKALIYFNMSEFQEKHTAARFIGAPPGYIGYEEAGQLTEAVRRRPYAVLLLDEIEKAHPDVLKTLLSLMESGQLTDSHGRVVDFRNTVIIMNSNIGAEAIEAGGLAHEVAAKIHARMLKFLSPEFIDRIDETVAFKSHSTEDLTKIGEQRFKSLAERLEKSHGLEVRATDAAKKQVGATSTESGGSGRGVGKAFDTQIGDPLADKILRGDFKSGGVVNIDFRDGAFHFTCDEALAIAAH